MAGILIFEVLGIERDVAFLPICAVNHESKVSCSNAAGLNVTKFFLWCAIGPFLSLLPSLCMFICHVQIKVCK